MPIKWKQLEPREKERKIVERSVCVWTNVIKKTNSLLTKKTNQKDSHWCISNSISSSSGNNKRKKNNNNNNNTNIPAAATAAAANTVYDIKYKEDDESESINELRILHFVQWINVKGFFYPLLLLLFPVCVSVFFVAFLLNVK